MTPLTASSRTCAAAISAAVAASYGIEVDLQVSADGEAMVHHDDVLGRLTEGEGRLDQMTAAELKRVPFRGSDERMMTLGELCDLVGGRVTMLPELKSRFDGDERLPLARGRRPRRLSRAGRADVVRSARSSTCCGKRPLACRAGLWRRNTGHIPIGIRCRRGCVSGMGSLLPALTARPHFVAYAFDNLPAFGALARAACFVPAAADLGGAHARASGSAPRAWPTR